MIRFDWDWLTRPENDAAVNEVAGVNPRHREWLALVQRLRKRMTADRARQIVAQADLRRRARDKFSRASRMWFTRRGLEQASAEVIARYKAGCFNDVTRVADLCCGIGGDSIGLGELGFLTSVDRDPEMAQLAQRNLGAYGYRNTETHIIPFDQFIWAGFDAVHIDPDRRLNGRTVHAERIEPSLSEILARVADQQVAIKLAPATLVPPECSSPVHREWIGHDRECKQQIVWLNVADRPAGLVSATVIDSTGIAHRFAAHALHERQFRAEEATSLLEWIAEPHSAIACAGLTDLLAIRLGAYRLSSCSTLLTALTPVNSPLVANFEVVDKTRLQLSAIMNVLTRHRLGPIEWKKNGANVSWWDRACSSRISGECPGCVFATRIGSQLIAIVARRLKPTKEFSQDHTPV